ncbi:Ribonuclease [Bacillus cereus]|uniref:EndoU domain-containing protein n=1 Tax=Bacillus cereus TaxID=1396 RepID=UPI000744AD50|nr:EndoU domain-containing protein [Bacillus cereus]ALZ60422.1 Ribonuclease [Bacillus cereus]
MSLNMYLGEVHAQTQSMNAVCTATIQAMEQAIQSIDTFAMDTVLQGQTYSSAKAYLVQTFRPLAQGIIYLCEELIRQNDAFPNEFQAKVASTDVIEQEIKEQTQEINQTIASIEAIEVLTPMPGVEAIVVVLVAMRKKLEEKLEHLYEFNYTSSNNYSTALQLAASITAGLAEVQSGKGFSPASGTFSTQGLNMEWTTSIQVIEENRKRQADNLLNGSSIEDGATCGPLNSEKKDESLLDTFKHGVEDIYEGALDFIQGAGSAVAEDYIGLTPPDNDKLESEATYQAGRFTGHVISTAGSILEIFEGISVIGGANFLTFAAEVGSGGLASPIVLPLDAVATAAGVGAVVHGGLVWDKSIQNAQDTLQKFKSSPSSGERINKVKENGKLDKEGNATKKIDNAGKEANGANSTITPEMEEKILWGQRKNPNKNEIIGGHSSGINNNHHNYVVEEIKINPDGTKNIKYTTQFPDGKLSKIKSSTVFPDGWSDTKIINSVENIGNSKLISTRARDGATWHRGTIDGVEIDVIKKGNSVISAYPTGKANALPPSGF